MTKGTLASALVAVAVSFVALSAVADPAPSPAPALSPAPAASPAPPAPKKKRVPKVVVLDFPIEKAFDANTNTALSEFYASALRKEGFSVITSADVTAALGVDKQRQLLGCTDSSCIAEIGNALGSDYLARGSVALLERSTALTLSLQDSRGVEVNRVSVRVEGREAETLLAKLEGLVPQLVQPLRDSGKLVAPAAPAPAAGLSATTSPSDLGSSHTASYVLFGVGGLGLITGAIGGLLALPGYNQLNAAAAGTKPLQSATAAGSLQQSVGAEQVVFEAGLGVGVVAAGVALALYLLAPGAPVTVTGGAGGGAGLSVRF